jgi:hypothetical protein
MFRNKLTIQKPFFRGEPGYNLCIRWLNKKQIVVHEPTVYHGSALVVPSSNMAVWSSVGAPDIRIEIFIIFLILRLQTMNKTVTQSSVTSSPLDSTLKLCL